MAWLGYCYHSLSFVFAEWTMLTSTEIVTLDIYVWTKQCYGRECHGSTLNAWHKCHSDKKLYSTMQGSGRADWHSPNSHGSHTGDLASTQNSDQLEHAFQKDDWKNPLKVKKAHKLVNNTPRNRIKLWWWSTSRKHQNCSDEWRPRQRVFFRVVCSARLGAVLIKEPWDNKAEVMWLPKKEAKVRGQGGTEDLLNSQGYRMVSKTIRE